MLGGETVEFRKDDVAVNVVSPIPAVHERGEAGEPGEPGGDC